MTASAPPSPIRPVDSNRDEISGVELGEMMTRTLGEGAMSEEAFRCRVCVVGEVRRESISPVTAQGVSDTDAGPGVQDTDAAAQPQPAAAEALEEEEQEEEALAARTGRTPNEPTQAEKEAHDATHLPHRSWCEWCVRHRLDNPPHRRVDSSENAVPEVQSTSTMHSRGTVRKSTPRRSCS